MDGRNWQPGGEGEEGRETRARENGRSHLAVVKDGNGEVSGD